MNNKSNITTESGSRKALQKMGYILRKNTKIKEIDIYHNGCYQIVNAYSNCIAAGEKFDLTFEDVLQFINEWWFT